MIKCLKREKNLRQQLEQILHTLNNTKEELKLSPNHVKDVVELGLELAGQPSLIPVRVSRSESNISIENSENIAFHLPNLSDSWLQCTVGLAHPHNQKIRPIVFDAKESEGRDDLVYAHLNHRLVQMCLRLITSRNLVIKHRSK